MPNDLRPGRRLPADEKWLSAGVFEAAAHDLRTLLRLTSERAPHQTAAIVDSHTLRFTPESGSRVSYDGAKRKKGSKVRAAVDILGHLLASRAASAAEKNVLRRRRSLRPYMRQVAIRCSWRTWTGATPERSRHRKPSRTVCGWSWSTTRGQGEVSRCCRDGGWWSAELRVGDAL
jgi:hypothetical protein